MNVPLRKIRSLVANLGLLATGEMLSKCFTLVAFAHLARVLGPASFGNIEFALAVIFIFSLLIDLGLGIYGAREIAQDREIIPSITRRVVSTRCVLTLITLGGLALFVSVMHLSREVQWLLLLFGLTLIPTPLLLQWVFQGIDQMQWVSAAQVVRYGTFSLLALLLLQSATQLWTIPLAELTAVTACVGFNLGAYHHRFGSLRLRLLPRLERELITEALPIGVSQLMWAAKFFFATVFLGLFAREEDVGQFSAALRIVVALHTFITLYFYNLLPSISQYSKESESLLPALVGGAIRVSSWLALLGCMIGTMSAKTTIELIYGADYGGAVIVLQLLLWMLGVTLWGAHYRCTLIGYGFQRLELLSAAIGAGFNILLIVLLYAHFGLAGAASAMLIAGLVTEGVACYFVHRYIAPIGTWRQLRQPVIVGLALVLGLYVLPVNPMWLKLGVVLALFIAGVYLFDSQMFTDFRALLTPCAVDESGATHTEASVSSTSGNLPPSTEMGTSSEGPRGHEVSRYRRQET
jgi:PST family polysaccharide transporter